MKHRSCTVTVVFPTGTGLSSLTNVTLNVIVNSATLITATAPAGTGTVNVTVTAPAGTSPVNPFAKYKYLPRLR
jgi:large repetitive protein